MPAKMTQKNIKIENLSLDMHIGVIYSKRHYPSIDGCFS